VFALAADDDGEHGREKGKLKKSHEKEHCQRRRSLREDYGEERGHKGAKCEDAEMRGGMPK
jgi:hypothetical protein